MKSFFALFVAVSLFFVYSSPAVVSDSMKEKVCSERLYDLHLAYTWTGPYQILILYAYVLALLDADESALLLAVLIIGYAHIKDVMHYASVYACLLLAISTLLSRNSDLLVVYILCFSYLVLYPASYPLKSEDISILTPESYCTTVRNRGTAFIHKASGEANIIRCTSHSHCPALVAECYSGMCLSIIPSHHQCPPGNTKVSKNRLDYCLAEPGTPHCSHSTCGEMITTNTSMRPYLSYSLCHPFLHGREYRKCAKYVRALTVKDTADTSPVTDPEFFF